MAPVAICQDVVVTVRVRVACLCTIALVNTKSLPNAD